MLFKYSQTLFQTNGFVSKYFNISRSCRQGSHIRPLVYIPQAEPVVFAIRGDSEIQGVKLHEERDGKYIETKTLLFNKNDGSVKICFDILTIYEKTSGSKVNDEKTKGIYIGAAKKNRPKFTNLVWKKDNVKTLGIYHGYNIQNDEIWKSVIDKMKNCVHV